jgi:hypothetical protein
MINRRVVGCQDEQQQLSSKIDGQFWRRWKKYERMKVTLAGCAVEKPSDKP